MVTDRDAGMRAATLPAALPRGNDSRGKFLLSLRPRTRDAAQFHRRIAMLRIVAGVAALCASLCSWTLAPAAAQDAAKDYPNRAIHIVVPFPAGGPADVAARLLAQRMNEDWGQPVIVDNRPGGNTVIGAQQVAKATPDGYTLLMAIDSTLVMNQ